MEEDGVNLFCSDTVSAAGERAWNGVLQGMWVRAGDVQQAAGPSSLLSSRFISKAAACRGKVKDAGH